MSLTNTPDRRATTLAHRQVLLSQGPNTDAVCTPMSFPGDARVELHLMHHATERALRTGGNDAARAWLEGLDTPNLRGGTVQDGTARGLIARLEEAISLCDQPAPPAEDDADDAIPFSAKDLRRKREILVASKGARIRFSRRHGILLVDRARKIHAAHCIQFEDRTDRGCLDGFRPAPGERPRLFSPSFLRPTHLSQGPVEDRLVLSGTLGRGPQGYPCRIELVGRKNEPGIRMTVWIDNRHRDHRLRIRFVGLHDPAYVTHRGTPGFEAVRTAGTSFLAATLVRACGRLRVGKTWVATPAAQILHPVEHPFGLGVQV